MALNVILKISVLALYVNRKVILYFQAVQLELQKQKLSRYIA